MSRRGSTYRLRPYATAPPVTGAELRAWRRREGLDGPDLARALGTSPGTLSTLELETTPLSEAMRARIWHLLRWYTGSSESMSTRAMMQEE